MATPVEDFRFGPFVASVVWLLFWVLIIVTVIVTSSYLRHIILRSVAVGKRGGAYSIPLSIYDG